MRESISDDELFALREGGERATRILSITDASGTWDQPTKLDLILIERETALELVDEVHRLRVQVAALERGQEVATAALAEVTADLADARERCPVHDSPAHGAEAEELRKGVERCLDEDETGLHHQLRVLLDRVDARDSLAHLETIEQVGKLKALARHVVDETQVTEIFEERLVGSNLEDHSTGEWVCNGCGARGESAEVEHDAPCILAMALAALEPVTS